ncbi:MFS transporter [Salsipaludibacter albus]|uniref:MFS transporter n=1 Tax=Salsipaludibacter albus TaxID=2849650 RepID=UPI001EE4840E|nr:MFS transporter [Salsipaludibacter albus]MBY5162287.1 MFS transporter [Salsipaludibacter albus]
MSGPRGGPRLEPATRVGGAGLLALLVTYGVGRQAFGLFVPAFQDEFGLSLATLGFVASAAQAAYLAVIVATGLLAARLGARVPVVAGCVVLSMGAALVAGAPGPVALAVGVTLAGASAGGTWAPFADAVSLQVPEASQPRALSLVNTGAPFGSVVASVGVLVVDDDWRIAWVLFAALGVVAAVVNLRVLATSTSRTVRRRPRPSWRWFLTPRSVRLFVVTLGAALASSAYFTFVPAVIASAGQPSWTGPAMWALLGLVGGGVGVFAGDLATRVGLRRTLAASWMAMAAAFGVLVAGPGSAVVGLGSATLFGVGFTVGYGQIVVWSQRVFWDRPTTGFTTTILFSATGFVVGPALFGVLAVGAGRSVALLLAAIPAVVAAAVPPAPRYRRPLWRRRPPAAP